MRVTRAVITAAGRDQRALPLQTLIDRDGAEKSVLCGIVEEALRAGIEEICVVVCPGDEAAYAAAAGEHGRRLTFVQQEEPLGHGHAVFCARSFVDGEPFLHLVGDHLYVHTDGDGCARQVVALAGESCASRLTALPRELLPTMAPSAAGCGGSPGVRHRDVVESHPTEAEQRLCAGCARHYSLLWHHVLTTAGISPSASRAS